jgi:hypothetical protein
MAAGLGFKTFNTGDVLSAADVNGYLMQGVLVFASAAARDSAITSPQEGQFAYLKDTNVTTYYTGSAWANLDTTGMVNPMTTTGDTIYSSSGSTPARLGIGSTGQVLTVAGGVPSWATAAGGGAYTSLATGSLSGATTTISSISGSYEDLYLIIVNPSVATDGRQVAVRINSDTTSNRHKTFPYDAITATATFDGTRWPLTDAMDNTVAQGIITMRLYDYANATTWKIGEWRSVSNNDTTTTSVGKSTGFGVYNQIDAVTSLQFFDPDGGNLDGGTYVLYGVK